MGDHSCPACDRSFESRRGLGVHHSHAHGERLPNRVCDHCGAEFYAEYEKRYCSSACLAQSDSYAGENNPNYRGGESETACGICGCEFTYYPSEKPGLYCPDCVDDEAWRDPPALEGSDNPRWSGGKRTFECDQCDEPFERYPANASEVTLCGDDCRADWLAEQFAGKGHPNWKGGPAGSYGSGWNRVRRQALERDGHACAVCGKDRSEIGRNPDVHHITPVRLFATSDEHDVTDAHYLANVVSLCRACHRRADAGAIPRERLRELATTAPDDH